MGSWAPARAQEGKEKGGGAVPLTLTYNVTPDPAWEPGLGVLLYADARRSPELGREDIFQSVQYPGVYPRVPGQKFDFPLTGVKPGEKIIIQGYMCAQGTTDCYPSDKDNPPSCSVEVHVLGHQRASCSPVFTWTGGSGTGGVLCRAECR
jgi:hypothetical protein